MTIGSTLLALRKKKQLSQEEVAEKLNVTRQTVSKWETNQSTPDFDKIAPLCDLYEISADELLRGKIKEERSSLQGTKTKMQEARAKGIGKGVFLYFIAMIWVMITIPVLQMHPIVSAAVFLLICGFATYLIIYTCITYKKEQTERARQESRLLKQLRMIIYLITLFIYLILSFITMAWHVTWILWIVAALLLEIIKLLLMLGGYISEK